MERVVRFPKVVIGESLQAKKLMLPKSFTRSYWGNAPTRATLLLPGRGRWEMEVFEDDRSRVWLQGAGWEAFARFYSLAHGYILQFKYRGGTKFFVRVFSLNCSEIKYPPPDLRSLDVEDDPVDDSDDDEELPVQSELPFFEATLSTSHFKYFQAHIPRRFSKKYIAESDQSVTLKMGNQAWDVNLNRQGGETRYPKLSAGWTEFSRDNSLRVGDKCVFQLLRKVPHVLYFEVKIVRAD